MRFEFTPSRWALGPGTRLVAALAVLLAALLLVSGCNLKVSDKKAGGKQNVDIQTPLGSLHVNTEADVQDTGLHVYPGARRTRDDEEVGRHGGSANVSIDSSLFGLKVVAVAFHSDDPPEKVLDFYRKELKSYGGVVECKSGMSIHAKNDTKELVCVDRPRREGGKVDLGVGNADHHRIVSVKPDGSGSRFALVYIHTRDKSETM